MLDPDPGGEHLDRRPDTLHRHSRAPEYGENVCLREADEWDGSLPATGGGKRVMTSVASPRGRAQLCSVEFGSPKVASRLAQREHCPRYAAGRLRQSSSCHSAVRSSPSPRGSWLPYSILLTPAASPHRALSAPGPDGRESVSPGEAMRVSPAGLASWRSRYGEGGNHLWCLERAVAPTTVTCRKISASRSRWIASAAGLKVRPISAAALSTVRTGAPGRLRSRR